MLSPIRFGDNSHSSSPPTPQQGVYGGIQNYGMQSKLPILDKRELEDSEVDAIKKNLNNCWSKFRPGYATPIAEMLASPGKSAAISGLGTAVIGGLMGFMVAKRRIGLAIGGLIGGGIGAVGGFFSRRQQNENLIDIMKRLPPGATKRDLLSDPVYEKGWELAQAKAASGSGDIFTGLIMASMMNSMNGGFNTRRR